LWGQNGSAGLYRSAGLTRAAGPTRSAGLYSSDNSGHSVNRGFPVLSRQSFRPAGLEPCWAPARGPSGTAPPSRTCPALSKRPTLGCSFWARRASRCTAVFGAVRPWGQCGSATMGRRPSGRSSSGFSVGGV